MLDLNELFIYRFNFIAWSNRMNIKQHWPEKDGRQIEFHLEIILSLTFEQHIFDWDARRINWIWVHTQIYDPL